MSANSRAAIYAHDEATRQLKQKLYDRHVAARRTCLSTAPTQVTAVRLFISELSQTVAAGAQACERLQAAIERAQL